MSKRNARYEIFDKMFYDYLVLFKTNKTMLGLKTYKNDKILLDYIRMTTKNSRKELFDYLNEHQINYIVFDSDNNYEIKKFEFNEYYRFINIALIDEFFEDNLAKTIQNKHKLKKYYMNKMQYLSMAQTRLNDINYIIRNYNIFLIYESKVRIVMSLNVVDKLVNHVFTKEVLIPACESRLDIRNVATRKNMGSSYGIKLLRKYIEYYKRSVGDNFYVLKLYISKYFYSIDHDVLKGMLRKILDDEDYIRVCNIIDSTNFEYINETIDKLEKKCTDKLPRYEKGKGLGIGNLSSQCLSIFYLGEIDHYIGF